MPERYFRIDRRDIAYFRFILEAHEGLATLSTVDAREGVVVLTFPADMAEHVASFLEALRDEMALTELDRRVEAPYFRTQENDDGA